MHWVKGRKITGHYTETHFNQPNVDLLIHMACLEYEREMEYPIHMNKEIIQKYGSDEVFCIQLWIAHEVGKRDDDSERQSA